MSALVLASLIPLAASHGGIISPAARQTTVSLWFNEGCQIGCPGCVGHYDPKSWPPQLCSKHSVEPTLPKKNPGFITYPNMTWGNYNPWMAPGFAPVFSPCGLAAGQANGSFPQNGDVPPPGYKPGDDMRSLKATTPTEWPIGSLQEVSWSIAANHGGGYAIRLCPLSSNLTEDCFQSHHLSFAGDYSWIQSGSDPSVRTKIRANRTTSGTSPSGSQWTKVPIPSCGGSAGGGLGCDTGCAIPQFPSPVPGLWGNGPINGCSGCNVSGPAHRQDICLKSMSYQIIDQVKVPDMPLGDYVMSFRWDCEQTPQIWSQCADIKITKSAILV